MRLIREYDKETKAFYSLSLRAWWNSSPTEKAWRLEEHIRYGLEHGVLDEVDNYLRGLKPDQWFYGK
jgi:hypothetical protein